MLYRLTLLLLLASLCAAARAADNDEVKFKAKTYAPHRTLQDGAYSGKTYAPSSSQPSVGTPLPEQKKSFWSIFKPSAHAPEDKTLPKAQALSDTPTLQDLQAPKEGAYKQEKQISVVTVKADTRDAPEKSPFDKNGKKVADNPYKAPDKPEGKNPMLRPRQGIKEPQ